MSKKETIIGIIGGAGPDATIDLQIELSRAMKKILGATSDQEHIRVITDNYTNMPDRSTALMANGACPLKNMISSIKNLTKLGCDVVLHPCNTAHAYLAELQANTSVRILDMIKITCMKVKSIIKTDEKVGVLCTDMTRNLELYKYNSIQFYYPDKNTQEEIMQSIFAAKAGYTKTCITDKNVKEKITKYLKSINAIGQENNCFIISAEKMLINAIIKFKENGINNVILGCTELPLCLDIPKLEKNLDIKIYNPTRILAEEAVMMAASTLAADH
jgi:aspartate racemase